VADRGYRGVNRIGDTEIATPGAGKKNLSGYEKRKLRRMFRRRTAIEPLIGHLKTDHRMGRSFYKGISGDQINVLLACSAWNLKKYMKKLREAFSLVVFSGLRRITDRLKRDLLALETLICNRYIPSKVWIGDLEMSF
jgi:IS5 family transposase